MLRYITVHITEDTIEVFGTVLAVWKLVETGVTTRKLESVHAVTRCDDGKSKKYTVIADIYFWRSSATCIADLFWIFLLCFDRRACGL